jgi:hypothetical protein
MGVGSGNVSCNQFKLWDLNHWCYQVRKNKVIVIAGFQDQLSRMTDFDATSKGPASHRNFELSSK